jgi:hypothetical protein
VVVVVVVVVLMLAALVVVETLELELTLAVTEEKVVRLPVVVCLLMVEVVPVVVCLLMVEVVMSVRMMMVGEEVVLPPVVMVELPLLLGQFAGRTLRLVVVVGMLVSVTVEEVVAVLLAEGVVKVKVTRSSGTATHLDWEGEVLVYLQRYVGRAYAASWPPV